MSNFGTRESAKGSEVLKFGKVNMRDMLLMLRGLILLALFALGCDCDSEKGGVGPPTSIYPNNWGDPAWSPDGKTIACSYSGYVSIDKTGSATVDTSLRGFYLMDADGTNLRRKTSEYILSPSWHPNGDSLLFSLPYNGVILKADTTLDSVIQLTEFDSFFDASWSPDGRKIIMNGLWIMKSDGSDRKRLYGGSAPSWSPDGERIAFASVVDEKRGLAVYDLRDSTTQLLISVPGQRTRDTDWSPNGREIFLSNSEIIYRYSFDDSSFVKIAVHANYPSVSPDGQRIVFLRHTWWEYAPETNGHLYIMDRDGSNVHQITFLQGGIE